MASLGYRKESVVNDRAPVPFRVTGDSRVAMMSVKEAYDMTELSETEYFTPTQVAKLLKINISTVLDRFGKEPGVIDMTRTEKKKPGNFFAGAGYPARMLSRTHKNLCTSTLENPMT
jgi:hypothetical protein